jgi:hypothetical protein
MVHLRIDPKLLWLVEKQAAELGVSTAGYIRMVLTQNVKTPLKANFKATTIKGVM